jgi:hypothetical protein
MAESTLPPASYEPTDVTFRFLLCGACIVLGVILLSALGVMWLYPSTIRDHRLTGTLPVYPAPRLQFDPAAVLQRFMTQERSRLGSYGWVDKDHGIVHIPIDEAMRRIAARGIPDWPSPRGTHP